ncbi:MAG: 4Fe-4S binding protein [Deltaproteobacteria bacterium]|nr:4Fe-4S binding protein [Deltaproteobacteria bacterium]
MSYSITDSCNGCGACARLCPVDAIHGEKKEKHRIDKLLCIECGACGRVCPEGAILDAAGNPCTMIKRSQWEKPRFDRKICTSCNICIDACPVGCLDLSEPDDRKDPHGYPCMKVEKACIGCGFCAAECPVGAVTMAVE